MRLAIPPVGAVSRPRLPSLLTLLGIALSTTIACAAPRVEQSPDRIVISNPYFTATFAKARGGALSQLRTAAGQLITGDHGLYTDRGIYGEDVYIGASHVAGKMQVRTQAGRVIVRSEGTLSDREGKAPPVGTRPRRVQTEPGTIAYWLQYTIGDGPTIRIEWGATPSFSMPQARAFFSYIFSVPDCIGLFANTDEGVLLQDMADHSTRTFQSSAEPLSFTDPWLGLMRRDATTVAFTDLHSTVPFANVFYHENGRGGAGVFFAWMDGGHVRDLEAGKEWRAGFTLRLDQSFEAFRASP